MNGSDEITYIESADALEASSLPGFFVGWPDPPAPETHLKILRQSSYVVLALSGKQVVGFINAVSDQTLAAYIPLLEVLPDYQGRGIGRELVKRMLNILDGLYMVDLVCDEDMVGFYKRCGLKPARAMMKRDFTRQSGPKDPP